MSSWRVQVTEYAYVLVEESELQVYEEEGLIYFVKNPKMEVAETVAVFKLEDIVGAYKEDAEISRRSENAGRDWDSTRVHLRKKQDDDTGLSTFPAVERT